jgi:hypothetical protein
MRLKTLFVISILSFILLPIYSYSDSPHGIRSALEQKNASQKAMLENQAAELCLDGNLQACRFLQEYSSSGNTVQPSYQLPSYQYQVQPEKIYQSEPTCPDYKRQRVETQNSVQYYDGCGRLERTVPKVGSGYNKVDDLNTLFD